jgi:hypothetical protein
MSVSTFPKQPNETLDYDVDLTDWLSARGDTISTYVITADPGLTLVQSAVIAGDDGSIKVKAYFSGGTDGVTYHVTVKVTTSNSRVKEVDYRIRVKEIA